MDLEINYIPLFYSQHMTKYNHKVCTQFARYIANKNVIIV